MALRFPLEFLRQFDGKTVIVDARPPGASRRLSFFGTATVAENGIMLSGECGSVFVAADDIVSIRERRERS